MAPGANPGSAVPGWPGVAGRLLAYGGLALVVAGLGAAVVPAGLVWGGLLLLIGAVAGGVALLALDGWRPSAMGLLADRRAPAELGLGLTMGVAVAVLAVGGIAVAGGVRWSPDASPGWDPVGWLSGGAALLAALALPAAAEEVLLRGYPLALLARKAGPLPALLITSTVFAGLHAWNPDVGWVGLAGIAAAGLFLGALVLRTGSLWWAAGAHLGWNWGLAWPADMAVSGLDLADTPGLEARLRGPEWVSGGAFGPEASAVAVVALLAAGHVVWRGGLLPGPLASRSAPLWAEEDKGVAARPRPDGSDNAR